ncbi:MAG: hypothetical protein L3J43_08780 [Sulfurovum sp.]|nr:hypothetical protein [Sulfurovum sp.]
MISYKSFMLMLFSLMLLNSCTNKEYKKQESVFIVFKTPTLKYADLGFMYENKDEIKVEIYGSGKALMSLEISSQNVCMGFLSCMHKKQFNNKVLSQTYPDNIIENIFRGKSIFNAKTLMKKSNGFTQKISEPNKYNITYSVLNKQIKFHDTLNNILIKVKRLN